MTAEKGTEDKLMAVSAYKTTGSRGYARLDRKLIPLVDLWKLCDGDTHQQSAMALMNGFLAHGLHAENSYEHILENIALLTKATQAVIISNEIPYQGWHLVAEYKRSDFTLDYSVLKKLASDFSKTAIDCSNPHACIEQIVLDSQLFGVLFTPLTAEKRLVGLLGLIKVESDDFTEADLAMCAVTERMCGPSLANMVLARDLTRHKMREEKLLAEICRCQTDERRRIGQELHDGIAQWIVGAAMEINGCELLVKNGKLSNLQYALNSAKNTLQTCIIEIRRSISIPVKENSSLSSSQ